MNRAIRTALTLASAQRRPAAAVGEETRLTLRVLPNDVDAMGHLNNGVYFQLMDLGRIDLAVRLGWSGAQRRERTFPVVMQETITFRRSLGLGQRFELATRIAGVDARSVFYEQRFLVEEQVCAAALVRMRFLRRGSGIDTAELWQVLGIDAPEITDPPEWVSAWRDGARLPSTRADASSEGAALWPLG